MKNQRFILPRNVKYIISELNTHGYRADVVGGCVRDFLLGKAPSDYDITTSASPEEMKEVFSSHRTIETGIKHGTLTVLLDGEPYEITTYRIDGDYTDNRHPDTVSFTRDVRLDLSRRDFTVNAMCYNEVDGILDLFGGSEDLEAKVIRAVGDPERRFTEDALRIIRALRFGSVLDFNIEEKTAAAARKCAPLLENVSPERIFVEWKKLIAGNAAYRIIREFSDIVSQVLREPVSALDKDPTLFLSADPMIRELSLFAPLAAPSESYERTMRALRSDNKRRTFGIRALSAAEASLDSRDEIIDSLLKFGIEATEAAIKLRILLSKSPESSLEALEMVLNSNPPITLSDLAVRGDELIMLGISGADVGKELSRLLYLAAHGIIKNEKEEIKRKVAKG